MRFAILCPFTEKKIYPHPYTQTQRVSRFCPIYILIPVLIPTFFLFQYQLIKFYKIIKNYGIGNIILLNIQY